jgi:hypothetical protein
VHKPWPLNTRTRAKTTSQATVNTHRHGPTSGALGALGAGGSKGDQRLGEKSRAEKALVVAPKNFERQLSLGSVQDRRMNEAVQMI